MRVYILVTTLILYGPIAALAQQEKAAINRKLSPVLTVRKAPAGQEDIYWIVTTDNGLYKDFLAFHKLTHLVRQEYPASRLLVIRATRELIDSLLLPSSLTVFADIRRTPREEGVINSFDATANYLTTAHHFYPAINGAGLVASIKENKPDTTDIDLRGRFLSTPLASAQITPHAGIMSTMLGGAGNTDHTGRGAAWGATLTSSDFARLLPDDNSAYQQYQVSVQNHSYGTGIKNYYGADAAAYDATVNANPQLVYVFSAGNAGNQASTTGKYIGIPYYANITGSFKMGKNLITTGATNGLYEMEALSSRGPAYDGRVKPELVAFGEDGSSGAAAIVSGTALLVQQALRDQSGQLPPAALVKSLLLNTADDVDVPGIDFRSGYGSLNSIKALEAALGHYYAVNSMAQNQVQTIPLTIPAGIRQLKIMLCWYDPPATPNAPKALVNDLDLVLENAGTGERWLPWVLNPFPHPDSLSLPATRRRDSLNNNEQITLDYPAAGNYMISVRGLAISTGIQAYAVTWQADTLNRFRWHYPTRSDHVAGGSRQTIRWNSTYPVNSTATIECSTDDGMHWQLLSNTVHASTGYFSWQVPDLYAKALLRCTIGSEVFVSDTFAISGRLRATTGLNCADSFMLTWHKPAAVNQFIVYTLGDRYLTPLRTTGDTNMVLSKKDNPSLYYTVAPLLANGFPGMKAFTFNYTTQGVECYIKTFLADRTDNATAALHIELGTLYGIQKISVEKLGITNFDNLLSIMPVTSLEYHPGDQHLQRGANTYRLKIQRQDGRVIYSDPQTVYYFGNDRFIVYPNPVSARTALQVLSAAPGNYTFTLFSATGQRVLHRSLQEQREAISLGALQKGLYFYLIRSEGKREQAGKIVVY